MTKEYTELIKHTSTRELIPARLDDATDVMENWHRLLPAWQYVQSICSSLIKNSKVSYRIRMNLTKLQNKTEDQYC